VLLATTGCAGTTSGSERPSPADTATSSAATPAAGHLVADVVARLTSRAGPVHFRADSAYETDLDTPLLRSEGVVDWSTSRGMATELADPGPAAGGDSGRLQVIGRIWVTSDGAVEVAVDPHEPPGQPEHVLGDTVSLVGLDPHADPAAGAPVGAVAMESTLRRLLDSQTFAPGAPETVEGVEVVHYKGTPRTADHGRVDVWVSAEGFVTQLLIHNDLSYSPIVMLVRFDGYGADTPIEPPPSSS
jgi:hypothetical protein